jgi:hypothetical protein
MVTRLAPKRRFTAMQRYVRSWNTRRHGADIVSVPPQPRHASLNCGEPRSSSGSLAMFLGQSIKLFQPPVWSLEQMPRTDADDQR